MGVPASVIAHRGASGYLPEHTLEAKALAHGQRADYIEQDVVATRDSALVVLHDIYLDEVTNVAEVFPERRREDGRFYVIDFDLAEIRRLGVIERRKPGTNEPLFPDRFDARTLRFRVATLAEEIELILGLNRSTRRAAGIYPEVKDPQWHLQHGIDLSRLVLDELNRYGYKHADDLVYVQCFDAGELRRMRDQLGTELDLIQLLPARDETRQPIAAGAFDEIAEYAVGVGLPFGELITPARRDFGGFCSSTPLLAGARSAGLRLHPYTFRRDRVPEWAPSFESLLRVFLQDLSIDGLFCDHPDLAVAVRDELDFARHQSP